MNDATKEQIIKKLNLKSLENEGGYFRLMYRSNFSSAIYYFITPLTVTSKNGGTWSAKTISQTIK